MRDSVPGSQTPTCVHSDRFWHLTLSNETSFWFKVDSVLVENLIY